MENDIIIYAVQAIAGIILIVKTFMIIPEREAWVIQRLGKYNRICSPGFKVRIPFIESIASKENFCVLIAGYKTINVNNNVYCSALTTKIS